VKERKRPYARLSLFVRFLLNGQKKANRKKTRPPLLLKACNANAQARER